MPMTKLMDPSGANVQKPHPLSRPDLLQLVDSFGTTHRLALSERDLSGIDLSSDAIRSEMDKRGHPYDSPPVWYSSSAGGITLQGADLTGANLQRALLWRGDFTSAILRTANLQKADLGVAVLVDADLTRANLECAILMRTDLLGANLSHARLVNADIRDVDLSQVKSLEGVYLSGAKLNNTYIKREQLRHGIGEEKDGNYYGAKDAYLMLKLNFLSLGRYDDASWALVKERQMERKANNPIRARHFYGPLELSQPTRFFTVRYMRFLLRHSRKWISDWLTELSCGYGEAPLRVVFWAFVVIIAFSILYYISGGITTASGALPTWLDYFQYSLSAFSTINLPDVVATNNFAKFLTSSEAMAGIAILALLMFSLGKRIARS